MRPWRPLFTAALVLAAACAPANDDQALQVFAAASLGPAFLEIVAEFEAARPGLAIEVNQAASSTLAAQIVEGAPADLFASADQDSMDRVVEAGLISDPQPLARNSLALAVPAGNPGGVSGLQDLARPELLVGLCAETVPCGSLAMELLGAVGVVASIDTAEVNVRALATRLESGELDVGIVYASDVVASSGRLIALPIPIEVETIYPIGVLQTSAKKEFAEAFALFATSHTGLRILTAYGFEAP